MNFLEKLFSVGKFDENFLKMYKFKCIFMGNSKKQEGNVRYLGNL